MRSVNPLGYALGGSVILMLLAGCSGGGGSSSPMPVSPAASLHDFPSQSIDASSRRNADPTSVLLPGVDRISKPDLTPGFADADAAVKAAVIISDAGANDIDVFSTKGKLVAQIAGVSGGLADTKAGSLYVANTNDSDILLYKNDYKTLLATLGDPGEYPVGESYDETTGIVGVTNIVSISDGPGTVSFYAKGETKPCRTVGDSAWGRVYFDAFDSKGNLFVDGFSTSGKVFVAEITGECESTTIRTLKVGNVISFPGGVQVTKNDDIAIQDQESAAIYTYKPPVKGSLGMPIATTTFQGAGDPVGFAFTSTGKDVWTADAVLVAADEYRYPAGGSPVFSISKPMLEPTSVVVTPVEVP